MKLETLKSRRAVRRRSTAKDRWDARSPRLLPSAIATRITRSVTEPAARHDRAATGLRVRAAAQQILSASNGLLEEPLVLAHLPENHPQRAPVTRVTEGLDAVLPLVHERLVAGGVLAYQAHGEILRLGGLDDRFGPGGRRYPSKLLDGRA